MKKTQHNTMVSIVTVVYDGELEIEKTIQSVIKQTAFDKIEYIIIDGNSKDKTLEIINKYQDQIDILVSEPDNGIYDAMNKAIDLANGKWINFMNAGDTFNNKNVIENIITNINDKTDIYYGSRNICKDNKIVLDKAKNIENIAYQMPFGHQASFIKTSLMKKHKYDLSYKLSADYDFFLKCFFEKCKFQKVDILVCNFSTGGLSYEYKLKSILETLKILSDYTTQENVEKSIYYKNFIKKVCKDYESKHIKESIYSRIFKKLKGIK